MLSALLFILLARFSLIIFDECSAVHSRPGAGKPHEETDKSKRSLKFIHCEYKARTKSSGMNGVDVTSREVLQSDR
jgi:hypothetical protein